ncbi:MAG: protein-tyrosine phosphatase family protein [Chloroflexota bacterium]
MEWTELPFGLKGRLYRSAMPFSCYDPQGDIWCAMRDNDIMGVVLLVSEGEFRREIELDLRNLYKRAGLDVIHLPIPDFGMPPEKRSVEQAIQVALDSLENGNNLVVHCLAGVGRTGTFTACMAKRALQLSGEQAVEWTRQFIPGALENPTQEQFVLDF